MAITSAGAGSGLDINSIISQLMAVEQQPLTKLTSKEAAVQSKISALGSVKSAVSELQAATVNLLDISKFTGVSASSGSTDTATITATNSADVGTYNLDVLQLATGQRLTSKAGSDGGFTSATQELASKAQLDALGVTSAKIKISFGSISGTTFSADSSQTAMEVDVPLTNDKITLANVRDAINAKKGSVTASIISDTTGSARLVLSNANTGANAAFKVEVTQGATAELSKMAFDPAVSSAMEIRSGDAAQDAKIKLNGIDVQRSSNTISDALNGVTVTLKKTTLATAGDLSSSKAISLSVSRTGSSIIPTMNAFVKAYNDLNTQIKSTTKYTPGTGGNAGTSSVFTGDGTIRTLGVQMRGVFNNTYSGDASLRTMSDIGLEIQLDGSIKLNQTKLEKVVQNDPSAIGRFFGAYDKTVAMPESSKNGMAYILNNQLTGILADNGLLDGKLDGFNATILDINKQRDAINRRLEATESRLRAQFTALDGAIATMKSTSNYLATQLANLPSISSS